MLTTIWSFLATGFGLSHWRRQRNLRKRALLRFHDGTKWRYADPFRAWREMVNPSACGFNLAEHGPLVDQGLEPYTTQCVEAICKVFGLKRFDQATGEGVTDWEALSVAHQLRDYIDEVKKNTNGSPITPAPGGSMPPSASLEPMGAEGPAGVPVVPATKPTEDCGSMPTESSCDAPTASERPSEPPLTTDST